MGILDKILSIFKAPKSNSYMPEGYCPNCWGREEYGGKFFEAVKTQNIDVNSTEANKGWVLDYADKHLSNIKLTQEDGKEVCAKCKLSYCPS